ncbi:DUF7144 family membrane protein [Streptomyces flavofungini]|uniref:DUF7144 domain-containing protein n=1 Tax=Streptomyces flavofungini TaxID=68200 RepID=A0ABS0X905_9ACTN|nr:hypothetical protein [Streptomyces flavofungini]MBJ3809690.1 hypothetical protein [Streptomyces flavofungini]GHC80113.1 hypothetical protein GCM10010349_62370 [Streptomyces flavofungini]
MTQRTLSEQNPAAVGFSVLAGSLMLLAGSYHALVGLVALIDDDFYVVTRNYTYEFDTSAWGWIHLLSGLIVAAAAFGVFTARVWGRAIGMILAGASAIESFFFIPYYPVWSIVIITLDVIVIWALAVYGRKPSVRT